jgi:hypothetical protein
MTAIGAPVDGIKGGSPRFKTAREELPELSRIYIQERNAKMAIQRKAAEIDLALKESEVIPRRRMKIALGFLLTGLRQRLISFASALPPRLEGRNAHEIGQLLDAEMRSALKDIANWPAKLANPNWQEEIDADLMPGEAEGNGESGVTPRSLGELETEERQAAGMRVKHAKQKEKRKGVRSDAS